MTSEAKTGAWYERGGHRFFRPPWDGVVARPEDDYYCEFCGVRYSRGMSPAAWACPKLQEWRDAETEIADLRAEVAHLRMTVQRAGEDMGALVGTELKLRAGMDRLRASGAR